MVISLVVGSVDSVVVSSLVVGIDSVVDVSKIFVVTSTVDSSSLALSVARSVTEITSVVVSTDLSFGSVLFVPFLFSNSLRRESKVQSTSSSPP